MPSTMIISLLLLALLLARFLMWAVLLRLGLAWARVGGITTRNLLLASLLVCFLQIVAHGLLLLAALGRAVFVPVVAEIASSVLIPLLVIAVVFRISFRRTLHAWLPTLVTPVVMLALVFLVLRPYGVEAFQLPTNAMAPTLLGTHWEGSCSVCGSRNYCSPAVPSRGSPPMICRDNFHVTESQDPGDQVFPGDRILVAKFFEPRRWDLVVFQYPENPKVHYVKRLVGLPGEEITIRDGEVWADGALLPKPDSISSIEYLGNLDDWYGALWGSPDSPALLADDEYFVLGDFSLQSKDSRLWRQGAPGHPPYAVPESHLMGVVTHIYWPPSRWRCFR